MAPPPSPPRDLSHHFSRATKNRNASSIKQFYRFFQIPGIGQLAGGLPNVNLFPFDTLEAQVAQPQRWTPTPNDPVPGKSSKDAETASHITVPKSDTSTPNPLKKIDLSTALQYGTAEGYPPLRSFIRQFTRNNLHPNVPYLDGPEVILTCGSTDGFSKTMEMLVEPWFADQDPIEEKPGLLTEVFVYMNAPQTVKPKGVSVIPVEIDGEGMAVEGKGGLRDVLENWDTRNGRRPHLIYTVTMGHNPTSGVLSIQRRKAIYALCSKYDIIIVEDDPYWYLQYPTAAEKEAESRDEEPHMVVEAHKPDKSSGYEFLDSLVPSYLSIDTEGRVVRLDTFSKTIAPGCRLGWITAQPVFIERLLRITETTTQQPSGFVQSMVAEAIMGPQSQTTTSFFKSSPNPNLFEGWHVDGWVRWLAGLRGVYERRMNTMSSILDKDGSFQFKQSTPVNDIDNDWGVITKTRLMSFDWPRGGMFLWVRIHYENHPLWQAKGTTIPLLDGPQLSVALMMYLTHKPHLVLGAPGTMFSATDEVKADQGWRYMRLCFAAEDEENVEPCARRFANGVQRFWRIKNVEEMEKLANEIDAEGVEMQGVANLGSWQGC